MRLPAALAASVLVAACARPKPPTITPYSVDVTSVSAVAVGLRVNLDVTNPNGFTLSVQKVTGDFVVDGSIDMGKTTVSTAISIPANASQRVTTDVSVPWTNVAALAPLALSGKPVPYTFKGVATVGGEHLNLDVPFSIEGKLTSAQLLQAGLNSLNNLPKLPGMP